MEFYIGLGSNLGNRQQNLERALECIKAGNTTITKISSIYETEPKGYKKQPWFLNLAAAVSSEWEPDALLNYLKSIEYAMGRRPSPPNHARKIDLDILLAEDRIVSSPDLIIPHPSMHIRRFVLKPLAEIAPDRLHPIFKRSIEQLLQECPDQGLVRKTGFFIFGNP
jgi:2-amino-4-hydroxy-6-hydroxymethyldihydropteridine diphosphokinase